jgi:hypothetical protein
MTAEGDIAFPMGQWVAGVWTTGTTVTFTWTTSDNVHHTWIAPRDVVWTPDPWRLRPDGQLELV